MNLAWHFCRGTGDQMKLRDGRAAVVGEWLTHDGPVVICQSGLHASWRAFDALSFCSYGGGSVCLVEIGDIVSEGIDKLVCRRRRIIFAVPFDDLLRAFARQAALSVLHLWRGEVPAVVRKYLETGNKEIRAAAGAAAGAAATATARAARAAGAAGDAAGAAAWAAWAARDAGAAARAAAARDAWAARDAGDAAWAAAKAARAAARAARAAGDAAGAAGDAAGAAKISDLNATLESLFFAAAIQEGFDPAVLG